MTQEPDFLDRVTLFPAPGVFRTATPIVTTVYHGRSRWEQIAGMLAWYFDASPDDLDVRDCYWGGQFGDESSADVLTVHGRIVGSFDRALTDGEWRELLAAQEPYAQSFKIAAE